jgi:hypothetical protein
VLFLLAGIFVGAVSDWLWLIGKGWWSQTIFFFTGSTMQTSRSQLISRVSSWQKSVFFSIAN